MKAIFVFVVILACLDQVYLLENSDNQANTSESEESEFHLLEGKSFLFLRLFQGASADKLVSAR